MVRLVTILAVLTLVTGCTGASDTSQGSSDTYERLPAMNVRHVLSIGDSSGMVFDRIRDVVVDSEGRVYVGDGGYPGVFVFSPAGDSLRRLGRKGQGPGEFTGISDLHVGVGDSLYVLDGRSRRISVFHLDSVDPFVSSFALTGGSRGIPADLLGKHPSEGFVLRHVMGVWPGADVDFSTWLTQVDRNGRVTGDSLLLAPAQEYLEGEMGGRSFVMPKPFGRRPVFAMGSSGDLYYGWTDSLSVSIYDISGTRQEQLRLPHDRVSVTADERDSVKALRSDAQWKQLVEEEIPSTKPAFRDLVIDDRKRLWIDVITTDDETSSTWWVIDSSEQTIQPYRLPAGSKIHAVRNDKVYSEGVDESGFPEVTVHVLPNP